MRYVRYCCEVGAGEHLYILGCVEKEALHLERALSCHILGEVLLFSRLPHAIRNNQVALSAGQNLSLEAALRCYRICPEVVTEYNAFVDIPSMTA